MPLHASPSRSKKKSAAPGSGSHGAGQDVKPQFLPLGIAALLTLIFASFSLLPRINASPRLEISFLSAAGCLLAALGVLWWSVRRTGRNLTYEFVPRPVHWVQAIMHCCIYAIWGSYWAEVSHEIPLILAQVFFLYAVDMLVCWSRRDKWILGFGPLPIIFSINLFLWFRDDWFFLQFVMVTMAVLGKEFLRWKRDGQSTHIFNPSSFPLFLVSIVLLATHSTPITWALQISQTFRLPPHFYIQIFVLGLIVQSLFGVTLVTLTSVGMLYALNLAYTHFTGLYYFIDVNIFPGVFLAVHLLVTDPATSPRKNFGKAIFGLAYGAGIFGMYGLLGILFPGLEFYDKLLCVPVLNLTVRFLDRWSVAVNVWFARQSWRQLRPVQALSAWTPRQANFGFMGVWVALFAFMAGTGFIGGKHPGSDPAFWAKACNSGNSHACLVLDRILDQRCVGNSARGCFDLGVLLTDGKVPRNAIGAAWGFGRACDAGLGDACGSLVNLVKSDGDGVLLAQCRHGDGASCFWLGSLYHGVPGINANLQYSANLFGQSCTAGFTRGCGKLGESYLFGQGVPQDMAKAKQILEKACDGGYGAGCFNVGVMHRDGIETPVNQQLALARFRQGCDLGDKNSCISAGVKTEQ